MTALLYVAFLLAVIIGTYMLAVYVAVRPHPARVRLPAAEDREHPVFSAEMMISYAAAMGEPESP